MVDNRLITLAPLKSRTLKKEGLKWFASGDNSDYISTDFLVLSPSELRAYKEAANLFIASA